MPAPRLLIRNASDAIKNAEPRFEALYLPEPMSGCWLWTGAVARFGHGSFRFNKRTSVAHRVSWILAGRQIPDGLQLCHRCDVPSCVNPDHLFLGTQADNIQDCFAKGRRNQVRGSRNACAKLDEASAQAIFQDQRSQSSIAAAFGVSKSVVGHIKTGRGWMHVTGKALGHAS